MLKKTIALAFLLTAPLAHPIIMRHDRETSRYAALGNGYPAVGFLGSRVTCTLIAPRWALGAAHTIEDYFNPASAPYVIFAGKRHEIDKIILHPRRVRGAVDSSADVVLLRLREPITDIAPVLLYDRDDEAGKIVTLVGFGETGNGLTGATNERGKVYGAKNRIEATFENSLMFTFDTPPAGLDLEGIGGPGDSGSPVLLEENGKLYTLGISAFNSGSVEEKTAGRYATVEGYARVSTHRKWITETMTADPASTIPMFGAYVRSTALPATSAAKAAGALIEAFNSGTIDRIAAFYRTFGRRRSEEEIQKAAASWQELIDQYGTYEIRGYKEAGPYDIAVFVRAKKGDLGRAVAVSLAPDGEHRVARMVMADVDEPAK